MKKHDPEQRRRYYELERQFEEGTLKRPERCPRCGEKTFVCAVYGPPKKRGVEFMCHWCLNNERRRAAGLPVPKKRRPKRVAKNRRTT